ncbi:Serine protease [Trichinella pseudospiralis]
MTFCIYWKGKRTSIFSVLLLRTMDAENQVCQSCALISLITCAGFAGYFAHAARTNPTFKRTTRIIYYSLAAGAAYVGVENARRDWRKLRNTFTYSVLAFISSTQLHSSASGGCSASN